MAEKVGELRHSLADPAFLHITYRRGAAGQPTLVVRGTGIRVQTIVTAAQRWHMAPIEIASEYGLTEQQVRECLGRSSPISRGRDPGARASAARSRAPAARRGLGPPADSQNARQQLAAIWGASPASLQYEALGRRASSPNRHRASQLQPRRRPRHRSLAGIRPRQRCPQLDPGRPMMLTP